MKSQTRATRAKTFLAESDIAALFGPEGAAQPAAFSLTAPMPHVLLVTVDPDVPAGGVCVRTATMGPLSWAPYTKSISIPIRDEKVARNLRPGAPCVLGLPSRDLLRQLTICRQRLPRGISEADVARFSLCKSLWIEVPSLHDCPVNFECVLDHVEPYYAHLVAFVRVVGASIDDRYLFWDRRQIIDTYPTNYADEVRLADGRVQMRVSMLHDIYACPTFPLTGKSGWCDSFPAWMQDLADEDYLSEEERRRVMAWWNRWNEIFADVQSPERAGLKDRLNTLSTLLAGEQWDTLHAFLK